MVFDEIQNVAGWDQFVRRLNEQGRRVYVTGSNSRLLSEDISTALRGRNYSVVLFPMSFKEFVRVKGMALEIIWDATSPKNAVVLGGFGKMHFHQFGGLAAVDASGVSLVGATGKILFTTLGAMQNSGYTVYIRGTKGSPQS